MHVCTHDISQITKTNQSNNQTRNQSTDPNSENNTPMHTTLKAKERTESAITSNKSEFEESAGLENVN